MSTKTAFKPVALVAAAAKLMGHSNPMVTLKIYTQVRDSEIMDSGTKITDFINNLKQTTFKLIVETQKPGSR